MKHKLIFSTPQLYLLLLGLFLITSVKAQTAGQSLSYKQTISTRFEINLSDRSKILPVEAVGMKPSTQVRLVSSSLGANQHISTTIQILSSDVEEPWMKTVRRIVSDQNGIKLYDASNNLLSQETLSGYSLEGYNHLKTIVAANGLSNLPSFHALTAVEISNMQQQGFFVQTLPDGTIKFQKVDTEILYNNQERSVSITKLKQGRPETTVAYRYALIGNNTVPVSRTERSYLTTSNGICYTRVKEITYTDYNHQNLP